MHKVAWGFVLAGFCSLLLSSYYDNIRGPLLPLIAASLGLAHAGSGWFLATGHVAATIATFGLMRALNLWSERTVMIALTTLGAATGLVAMVVQGPATLIVLAAFIGATISTLGTMANVLVLEGAPPASNSRYLAALHTMFGVGSMAATGAVALGVSRGMSWPGFFVVMVPAFAGLGLWCARRVRRGAAAGPTTIQSARLAPMQALVVATFAVYVAGEVTTAMWMTAFLVEARALSVAAAASFVTVYFLVMTASRLVCAVFVTPRVEPWLLRGALVASLTAFAWAYVSQSWAIVLVGLYGPFFPVFLARASRVYPDKWRSMTIWIIVVMNVTIGTVHVTLGTVADFLGIRGAYLIPATLLLIAGLLLEWCLRRLPLAAVR